jgi:hypothetical protein
MAWAFRRGLNFGPLRINLSKSGVGYSVGTRGFRIGQDSRGRRYQAVSIPKTGIYRRDYLPNTPTPPTSNLAIPPANPVGIKQSNRVAWPIYIIGAVLLYVLIRILSAII